MRPLVLEQLVFLLNEQGRKQESAEQLKESEHVVFFI